MKFNKTNPQNIFGSPRMGSYAWSHSASNIKAWKEGKTEDVMPVTLEYAPNLKCNQACHECPYRIARKNNGCGKILKVGEMASEDDISTSSMQTACKIIDTSNEAGVKFVIWTGGGETCIWKPLPEAIKYAASRYKLYNAIYSNGIQLGYDHNLANTLLINNNRIVFIRISINAVSENIAKKFSASNNKLIDYQLRGLESLLDAREALWESYNDVLPAIQVSTIIDNKNIEDLPNICDKVSQIYRDHRKSDGDCIVIRPLTKHCNDSYSVTDHNENVTAAIIAHCGKDGFWTQKLNKINVKTYLGFNLDRVESGEFKSYAAVLENEYSIRNKCLANGLFLTVGPSGKAYCCVDRNCYPDWEFGDILKQSVREIYQSEKRRLLLDKVNSAKCGPSVCEATCRNCRLNKIANAIYQGSFTQSEIDSAYKIASNEPLALCS